MKSSEISEVAARFHTFCHEFFIKSPRVFSYDLENSCCRQNAIQRNPIHAVPNVAQMFCGFWKLLGFIAWRFHIAYAM